MELLRVSHDNLTILSKRLRQGPAIIPASTTSTDEADEVRSRQEVTQILRVLLVLREYVAEFDSGYMCERLFAPLARASKGKSLLICVRLQLANRPPHLPQQQQQQQQQHHNQHPQHQQQQHLQLQQQQQQQIDDIELVSHVNETIGSLRRQIFVKAKISPHTNKIDMIINNVCVECAEDNKTLGDFQLKDKLFIVARVLPSLDTSSSSSSSAAAAAAASGANTSGGGTGVRLDTSSTDSSSSECASGNDDSPPSKAAHSQQFHAQHHQQQQQQQQHNVINSPSLEHELMLPSVILSLNEEYVQFLVELAELGCRMGDSQIKECSRGLLDVLPIAKHAAERIQSVCRAAAATSAAAATPSSPPPPTTATTAMPEEASSNQDQANKKSAKAIESLYFACSQTQCWYYLKVTHAMLMPAVTNSFNCDEIKSFQVLYANQIKNSKSFHDKFFHL